MGKKINAMRKYMKGLERQLRSIMEEVAALKGKPAKEPKKAKKGTKAKSKAKVKTKPKSPKPAAKKKPAAKVVPAPVAKNPETTPAE